MKKSSKDEVALTQKPLPPLFRMADEIVNLLPMIENQQKATVKYFRAEIKAMNQFLDAMDSIKIRLPFPRPPLIPLMPKFIKAGPNISKFQKELTRYYSGSAKRIAQFEKDLTTTPKRR